MCKYISREDRSSNRPGSPGTCIVPLDRYGGGIKRGFPKHAIHKTMTACRRLKTPVALVVVVIAVMPNEGPEPAPLPKVAQRWQRLQRLRVCNLCHLCATFEGLTAGENSSWASRSKRSRSAVETSINRPQCVSTKNSSQPRKPGIVASISVSLFRCAHISCWPRLYTG